MVTPSECPNVEKCGAPVCPLDPSWRTAAHLPSEPVCGFLLAANKVGADERYEGDAVYAACRIALPLVCEQFPDIARKVNRAAATPFRVGRVGNLRRERAGNGD